MRSSTLVTKQPNAAAKNSKSFLKKKSSENLFIQPKFIIGQSNDIHEQQANAAAKNVMQGKPATSTPITTVTNSTIQTKSSAQQNNSTPSSFASQLTNSKGKGSALPQKTNNQMNRAFGTNFNSVKVHTGASSVRMNNQLRSRAFTNGNDIYFNSGEYMPESPKGKSLLAHELTHTIQQRNSATSTIIQKQGLDDLPPTESFSDVWTLFQQSRFGVNSLNSMTLALRLSGMHMELADSRTNGLSLAMYLLTNGQVPAALRVLENYEGFLWMRNVMIDRRNLTPTMAEGFNINGLLTQVEQLTRQSSFDTAIEILGLLVFYAQVNLSILSEDTTLEDSSDSITATINDIDPDLPGARRRERDIINHGVAMSSITRSLNTPSFARDYSFLRNVATTFLRLQREAILNNDTALAAIYGQQHTRLIADLRQRNILLDTQVTTLFSTQTHNSRGDVGYTIHGTNNQEEIVTPLPGTATPAQIGFFPSYHGSLENVIEDMSGQTMLVNDLLTIPAIRTAFPTGEINLNDLATRVGVWEMVYHHIASTQSAGDALTATIRFIERYSQSFTIHTEYNIRDFGMSYLSTEFPEDFIGRAVRDCGVYALTIAYELFRVARSASPRINLEFELVSMPEHVTLLVLNNDANNHYLVNNDVITGPNTGTSSSATVETVAQAYASTFERGFSVAPAMSVSLGDTSQSDNTFRRSGWERYRASAAWGFNSAPTGPDDTRNLEQRTRETYERYYNDVADFDRMSVRVISILNGLSRRVQTSTTVTDRTNVLNTVLNGSQIHQVVAHLWEIFQHYGVSAAARNTIVVNQSEQQNVRRHIVGQTPLFLMTHPDNHPLVKYCLAVLLLEHLGTARTSDQNQIIQQIRVVPVLNTLITNYITSGFPLNF